MISIGAMVLSALATVGVQVCRGAWRATAGHPAPPDMYIVFTTMTVPAAYHEDAIQELTHYVYLELWSKVDYSATQNAMRTLLLAVGFDMIEERENYETDTKMWDLSCTYIYREEL